jgi:hypothetical protein
MKSMPSRLRAPALLTAATLIVLAIGGVTRGWGSVADVAPIPIVAIVALYLWGGRDTDAGALIRRELDERQAHQRLEVQALVGRVLSLAVGLAYMIAVATKAKLWPWAILLGLMAIAFVAGRLIYSERGHSETDESAI